MRRVMVFVVSAAMISLSSCSSRIAQINKAEQKADLEKKVNFEQGETNPSTIVRTEESLTSLLESVKAKKVEKNVTLVGKLELGSNPKWDSHKLSIGETSLHFVHDLDKEKYDGQTVLVLGDIRYNQGTESQLVGNVIVNVQHVEIMK